MKKVLAFFILILSVFSLASCGAKEYYGHGFHGKDGERIYFSTHVIKKQYFEDGIKVDFNFAYDEGVEIASSYSIYSYSDDKELGILKLMNVKMDGNSYIVKDYKKTIYSSGAYSIETFYNTDYITLGLEDVTKVFSKNTDYYYSYFFMAPASDSVMELSIDTIMQTYPTSCVRYSYYEKYIKLI